MQPEKISVLFATVAPKPSTVFGESEEYLLNEESRGLKEINIALLCSASLIRQSTISEHSLARRLLF